MGKKGKSRAVTDTYQVIGVLADDSVIRTVKVEDQPMKDAVATIARDLEKHINSTFSLKDGINIDTDTVLIPGIAKYDPNETVANVAKQLPLDTYMTIVYSPINSQGRYLTNVVNKMAVDQCILSVNHNAPPWPASTSSDDKLDQLLKHIKAVERTVNIQGNVITQLKTDNATLKADNATLKADNATLHQRINIQDSVIAQLKTDNTALSARVEALEEENQDLRQTADGHTTSLYKLRRRILLDQARKDILRVWAPSRHKVKWTELCAAMTKSEVQDFIISNHIFQRPLLDDAFHMIYEVQSAVRLDGNDVAHGADKDLVWDAIVHGDAGSDVSILKNIFGCVYNEDLR